MNKLFPLYVFIRFLELTYHLCYLSQNQTVIVMKAPPASYIEVPDPDEVSTIIGGTLK